MSEALQNLSSDGLVIRDGFAAIPAWGWDSTQGTILGVPVHADVNNAIPVIPSGGQIIPSLYLTFANGWVLALTTPFTDLYAAGGPSMIVGTAYLGEGNHIFDRPSYHSIRGNLGDLAVLEATIRQVANYPVRDWDDLIATYIEANPYRPGISDAILTDYGVPVWAIIGAILLTDTTPDEVAQGYEVSREAVNAALAYYQRYRPLIDERIAANNVGAA